MTFWICIKFSFIHLCLSELYSYQQIYLNQNNKLFENKELFYKKKFKMIIKSTSIRPIIILPQEWYDINTLSSLTSFSIHYIIITVSHIKFTIWSFYIFFFVFYFANSDWMFSSFFRYSGYWARIYRIL